MALVGVLAASPALGGPAAVARAATLVDTDCAAIQVEDRSTDAISPSLPFELLDMQEAWRPFERLGRVPGAGVRVAVVDSGDSAHAEVTVVGRVSFSTGREPGEYHGTAVAGLITAALRDTEPEPLPVGFRARDRDRRCPGLRPHLTRRPGGRRRDSSRACPAIGQVPGREARSRWQRR